MSKLRYKKYSVLALICALAMLLMLGHAIAYYERDYQELVDDAPTDDSTIADAISTVVATLVADTIKEEMDQRLMPIFVLMGLGTCLALCGSLTSKYIICMLAAVFSCAAPCYAIIKDVLAWYHWFPAVASLFLLGAIDVLDAYNAEVYRKKKARKKAKMKAKQVCED